ncbi:MAG: methylated-DNA--[protein]-cysteine S-methyltransferase [Clostridia bacterium]|nr:methylated-DNA--[protein]-cysteine S-methyltransferase [Clostridia bacterium]
MHYSPCKTTLGTVYICEEKGAITHLGFGKKPPFAAPERDTPLLCRAHAQLKEYLCGARTVFELPLAPAGTSFQQEVWAQLLQIPYGERISYGKLARQMGRPSAARAVGAACGRNPIAIFIPCHRVVGQNGSLTGYAWGKDIKMTLLTLEGEKNQEEK